MGGAESETTRKRNRMAFDGYGFRTSVLNDVRTVDCSTVFLGNRLRMPVLMAPIGSLQLIDPEGAVAVAKAALVGMFFMHLAHRGGVIRLFALGGFVWLALLFTLTLADYLTRGGTLAQSHSWREMEAPAGAPAPQPEGRPENAPR